MNTRNYHPIEQAKVTKKQRKPTKKTINCWTFSEKPCIKQTKTALVMSNCHILTLLCVNKSKIVFKTDNATLTETE